MRIAISILTAFLFVVIYSSTALAQVLPEYDKCFFKCYSPNKTEANRLHCKSICKARTSSNTRSTPIYTPPSRSSGNCSVDFVSCYKGCSSPTCTQGCLRKQSQCFDRKRSDQASERRRKRKREIEQREQEYNLSKEPVYIPSQPSKLTGTVTPRISPNKPVEPKISEAEKERLRQIEREKEITEREQAKEKRRIALLEEERIGNFCKSKDSICLNSCSQKHPNSSSPRSFKACENQCEKNENICISQNGEWPSSLQSVQNGNSLNTNAELLATASELGRRNAIGCVGLTKDEDGYVIVSNNCTKVNFGYCYDEWVPDNSLASSSNPFQCNATGKPSYGASNHVGTSSTKKLPLQDGALSKKVHIGPCMSEVKIDDKVFSYLHAEKMSLGNVYRCKYTRNYR